MDRLKNLLPLIIPFVLFYACTNSPTEEQTQEETASVSQENIIGKWELEEGYRNGRLTESLTDTYFEFFMEGKMRTNLGAVGESDYVLEGKKISQHNDRFSIVYQIEDFSDTSLVLSMTLRDFPFLLKLKKAIPEPEIQ